MSCVDFVSERVEQGLPCPFLFLDEKDRRWKFDGWEGDKPLMREVGCWRCKINGNVCRSEMFCRFRWDSCYWIKRKLYPRQFSGRRKKRWERKSVVKVIGGRKVVTVYSSTSTKKVLEGGGVYDLHCAYLLGMFDYLKILDVVKGMISVSSWVYRKLQKLKWFKCLPDRMRSMIFVDDLRVRFWTNEMVGTVRRLWKGGMEIRDICGYLFLNYCHKIRVKTLIKRFWVWGWVKLRKPPP